MGKKQGQKNAADKNAGSHKGQKIVSKEEDKVIVQALQEKLNQDRNREKKLQTTMKQWYFMLILSTITVCIPAGLFLSSAFRFASESMQPNKLAFIVCIVISAYHLAIAYEDTAWELRRNDTNLMKMASDATKSKQKEFANNTLIWTAGYSAMISNIMYFLLYGMLYNTLPKGLTTSITYGFCSVGASWTVQLSSSLWAGMYSTIAPMFSFSGSTGSDK